jgi:hypothetical protein
MTMAEQPEHALIVHYKLSDEDFGTIEDRDAALGLADRLEVALRGSAGECDGHEFGEGFCRIYVYGSSSEALVAVVTPTMRTVALPIGSFITKRSGPPGTPEQRVTL